MKLGDKCVVAGLDGCVITGFKECVEGNFVRVKTTQNEDWHPESAITGLEVIPKVKKPEPKLKPMTSSDL